MQPPDQSNLVAATKAAPNLDPQSAVAAAMVATSQQDAVGTATATAAVGGATSFAQQLQTLNPQLQSKVWQSLSTAQQQQYRTVGYNPPAAPIPTQTTPAPGSGLLHDVMGVGDAVGHALGTGLHDTLNVLGSGLRAAWWILGGDNGASRSPLLYFRQRRRLRRRWWWWWWPRRGGI